MRLTQLKLAGFKSFVEPTVIPVPSQLVGVVGPIPKMMLVEMVVRHPNLMPGVLDRQDRLRVSVALCDRMFLSFWVSLSEYG